MTAARSLAGALACATAVATTAGARAECPDRFEFVLIADDSGELALSDAPYGGQPVRPAINPDGKVAFTAWLDEGGKAIQLGDEHDLLERLRDRDADPESDWTWLSDPLPNIEGKVVFGGMLETEPGQPSVPAIAEVTAAGRIDVLATGDAGRAGSTSELRSLDWQSFEVASNGEVAFSAMGLDGESVILWGAGGVTRAAVTAEPGTSIGNPVAGGPDELGYFEQGATGTTLRAATGVLIAETDPATGLGPLPPAAMGEGGSIAYVFSYADPERPGYAARQIRRYSSASQTSRVIADSALGHFGAAGEMPHVSLVAGNIDVDGTSPGYTGCIVFDGYGDEGRDAIFIADEDGVATVVIEGDELLGEVVSFLAVGTHAVNGRGQIAFWAQAGARRKMIVRADPADAGSTGPSDAGDPPADPIADAGERGTEAGDGGARPATDDASEHGEDGEHGGGLCAVRSVGAGDSAIPCVLLAAALALLARPRRRTRDPAQASSVRR